MILILIGQNDDLREVKYEPYPTFTLWDVKYGSYSLPLGHHSVHSKLISCTLVQIHDIALHIHNNNIICD